MLLAKSCSKKHNPKISKTLKLGTLHEYRETEIEQIADPDEGRLSFRLIFDGRVEIEKKWLSTITENAISFGTDSHAPIRFPGLLNAHFETLQIDNAENDANKIALTDSSAIIHRESPNSFIFCVSHVRKTKDAVGIFPDYDDYWYIMSSRSQAFATRVGELLLKKIKEEYQKGNFIIPKNTNIESISIDIRHGNVSYMPREIHIKNEGDLTIDKFMSSMYNMAFIKPPTPFSKEKEYRFQYTIISEDEIICPNVKNLIINAEPLLELLI